MDFGAQSVMITGMREMLLLSVDSWAIMDVRGSYCVMVIHFSSILLSIHSCKKS